jgi:hypothetical protein
MTDFVAEIVAALAAGQLRPSRTQPARLSRTPTRALGVFWSESCRAFTAGRKIPLIKTSRRLPRKG